MKAAVPERRRSLNLRLGGEIFPVKKTVLLEKLALFQENPTLLGADDYEVKACVPSVHFQRFITMIEGGPVSVSESTCASFWQLSDEFGFEFVSAACTAFLTSRETALAVRPRVTITVGNYSATYESFKSYDEIVSFAIQLKHAEKDGIVVERMDKSVCTMEKAVEAVYWNTVSDLGLSEATKPFLALVLWEIHDWIHWESIDAMIYCLNGLNEMAPTAFDKAKILLLSQSDYICRDDYVFKWGENSRVVSNAIALLKSEKNGRRKEARALLRKMRNTGRFAGLLGEPSRAEEMTPASGRAWEREETASESHDGGVPISVLPGTPDRPSWLQRLFVSWFRPPSVSARFAPMSIAMEQRYLSLFSRSVGAPDGFPGLQPNGLRAVDINWFK
jgi:hypothetical protein